MNAQISQQLIDAEQQLQLLESSGAEKNQTFLFHYCKTLLNQVQQGNLDSITLTNKISHSVKHLQQTFDDANSVAQQQISQLLAEDGVSSEQLNELLNAADFNAICHRHSQHRQAQTFNQQTLQPISTLTHSLNQQSEARAKLSQSQHLDSYLQQADHDLFDSFDSTSQKVKASDSEASQLTLQSVQLFKQSQQQFNVSQLVQQAIADSPDEPGPLNPHMLAIRSLTLMQGLSPKYLERFVSYTDSLLWLEQSNERLAAKKKL